MTTTTQSTWIDVPTEGPFDLTASARFLEGFAPAARKALAAGAGGLRLAFPAAPSWRAVGVLVRQEKPSAPVKLTVHGDRSDIHSAIVHVQHILSLDVDSTGFARVGLRDPVVAELQRRYPGLRPVSFHSPYEAACYAIIAHRIKMTQAATIKDQLSRRFGVPVDIDGVELPTFPAPSALRAIPKIPMISEQKSDRLHIIAEAAERGDLDATKLRSLPLAEALTRLQELPGIGQFSADLVLLRGAAHPDGFPRAERRLHEEMARAYELTNPTVAELAEIAEGWRPYRTWVSLLLRTRREEETGEIATGKRAVR